MPQISQVSEESSVKLNPTSESGVLVGTLGASSSEGSKIDYYFKGLDRNTSTEAVNLKVSCGTWKIPWI